MASGCAVSLSACGEGGVCVNNSLDWTCQCTFPFTNIGDLNRDLTRDCDINIRGVQTCWALCGLSWTFVCCCAILTAVRLWRTVPYSAKRQSEIALLSVKSVHAFLFIVVSALEISDPTRRALGLDFATTLIYCFACAFFWTEFKLFLIVPTLSNVTSIARVIAPKPMQMYTKAAPFLLLLSTLGSFILLGMVLTEDQAEGEKFGIIHIELQGVIAVSFLGSSWLAMTAILRKFKQMLSDSTNPNSQKSKISNVEEKIRALRIETVAMLIICPPLLWIFGALPSMRQESVYLLPLAWSSTGLVTLRFIYMSHQTVQIHLRRNRPDFASNNSLVMAGQQLGGGGVNANNPDKSNREKEASTSDLTAFSSSIENAKHAISSLARRRKKRKPKFVNAMTRVEEERTAALTRAENEPLSFVNSNDVSTSKVHDGNIIQRLPSPQAVLSPSIVEASCC